MQTKYVMIASGNTAQPRINHMVFQEDLEFAKAESAKVARHLASAGYFQFTLYDVSADTHVIVATLTVEQQAPVITIK